MNAFLTGVCIACSFFSAGVIAGIWMIEMHGGADTDNHKTKE